MNNSTVTSPPDLLEDWQEMIYFYVVGVLTVLVNAVVLAIAFLYVDFRAKPIQVFVVSMTAADCLYGLIFQLTHAHLQRIWPTFVCGAFYVTNWACQMASVVFLLLLNIDKFVYIAMPLHYNMYVTDTIVYASAVIAWAGIATLCFFSYYGPFSMVVDSPPELKCLVQFSPPSYWLIVTVLVYVMPLVVCLIISGYIFIVAQTSATQWNNTGAGNRHQPASANHRQASHPSSTMWTAFTYLPYRTAYIIYSFCYVNSSNDKEPANDDCVTPGIKLFVDGLMYLMMLSPIGNGLVTIVTQRSYRTRALQWMGRGRPSPRSTFITATAQELKGGRDDDRNESKKKLNAKQNAFEVM